MYESRPEQRNLSQFAVVRVDQSPFVTLADEAVLVTKIYPSAAGRLMREVEVATPQERQQLPRMASQAFDRLVTLCTRLSVSNTYELTEVQSRFLEEWSAAYTEESCGLIADAMPPEVFTMDATSIRVGNILLAGRQTTKEDIMQERKLKYERDRAEIDRGKISILEEDHARITIDSPRLGTRNYYMPLDRGSAFLAVRVIAVLQYEARHEGFIDGKRAMELIWAQMPTIERELFLRRRSDITGGPSAIKKPVLDIMRKLTNLLGLTRETSGERFKLEGTASIILYAHPPADPSELQGFSRILPPGTDRELVNQAVYKSIPEPAIATAKLLLEHELENSVTLSQNQALTILDLITDPDIKRAIRHQIKEMDIGRTSANVLETLREKVMKALGESFYSAWRDRMIAGNSVTGNGGNVRLIGGELPHTTNLARLATKKWYVGPSL